MEKPLEYLSRVLESFEYDFLVKSFLWVYLYYSFDGYMAEIRQVRFFFIFCKYVQCTYITAYNSHMKLLSVGPSSQLLKAHSPKLSIRKMAAWHMTSFIKANAIIHFGHFLNCTGTTKRNFGRLTPSISISTQLDIWQKFLRLWDVLHVCSSRYLIIFQMSRKSK